MMKSPRPRKLKPSKLEVVRRKKVGMLQEELVKLGPLQSEQPIPLVHRTECGMELISSAGQRTVESLLNCNC